jgi:hypothetical protein
VRLVIAAARRILESEGKPIRVTSASIARALGRRDIGRRLSKMPLTRVALGKLIESQADFDKRRIHWSVGVLILKELSLDRSRILRLAGIRHQRWRQHLGTIANEVALQTGARHAFRQQVASL